MRGNTAPWLSLLVRLNFGFIPHCPEKWHTAGAVDTYTCLLLLLSGSRRPDFLFSYRVCCLFFFLSFNLSGLPGRWIYLPAPAPLGIMSAGLSFFLPYFFFLFFFFPSFLFRFILSFDISGLLACVYIYLVYIPGRSRAGLLSSQCMALRCLLSSQHYDVVYILCRSFVASRACCTYLCISLGSVGCSLGFC